MESSWCMKKNDIRNVMKIPVVLTSCLKADCDQWRGGECIHIRKAGKPGRPQVFSRQDTWPCSQEREKIVITVSF